MTAKASFPVPPAIAPKGTQDVGGPLSASVKRALPANVATQTKSTPGISTKPRMTALSPFNQHMADGGCVGGYSSVVKSVANAKK